MMWDQRSDFMRSEKTGDSFTSNLIETFNKKTEHGGGNQEQCSAPPHTRHPPGFEAAEYQ
jgi:hypothetical protein